MSEFLAEASVRISADATAFRAELSRLRAEASAIRPIVIPVRATIGTTLPRDAAAQAALANATNETSLALKNEAMQAGIAASSLAFLDARTQRIGTVNEVLAASSERLAAAQAAVAGSSQQVALAQEATAAAQAAVGRAAASGVGAQQALAASALQVAVAFEKQALSANKALATSSAQRAKQIATANLALAAASDKFALAQAKVVGVSGAAAAAQVSYQRAVAATVAATDALDVALRSGTAAQQSIAAAALRSAQALEAEALAAREAALANEQGAAAAAHHSIQLRNLGRGAGTAALAAIGLRGATLTANAAFIGGAAAAIGFGKAIQTAANFETSLNVFAATAGATSEQLQEVSDTAKQLGQDITLPAVNAQDAADAMSELAKAGLSVQDSISGARGVLQLATAASIDNAQATQIAASALNAFGLQGDQAVHVADVLANAANESQGSIVDVGISLQQAAAVARQVGVSFEDTVSLLTLLARNGIRGSDAGTSLRVAFTRLVNPTEKARKVLEGLNVQLRDSQGNIRPEIFAEFAQAQANLSRSQQDANAGIVFGTDALRAYSIAAREGITGLANVREELDKQGTAAELASARTKGTAGSFERLKNAASGFGQAIGEDAAGPTKDFVDILAGGIENMTAGIEKLNSLGDSASDTAESFAELAEAAGRVNRSVELRQGKAQQSLLDEQTRLNKALEESLGPGIAATRMIEDYRDALHSAALQSEGLRNRIDETTDRFARQPTPPVPAPGPTPIGPTAKQDRAIALAQAAGDLSEVERLQKAALARARKAFENSKGNVNQRTALFEKVTQAEVALASTQSQMASEAASAQQKAATERERRAREAATAQQKADQAVLDSFAPGQQRINLAEIDANATERLNDDIAVQKLIANTASREIAIIERSVKDVKKRNEEIAARVAIIKAAGAELDRLRKEAADAAVESARNARNVLTETLGKRLQLAELRGGKDAVLAAFDKAIVDARQRVKNWKKLGLIQLDEQIALQTLVNDRKDFLEGLEKDIKQGQGTTAFDLLKQFSETFSQNAGNLINASQPFAGPSGFTADIAQFLIRRPQPERPVTFPGKAADNTLVQSNTSLTQAIDRLADVIIDQGKAGNTTTGPVTRGNPWAGRRWFGAADEARRVQEG